METAPDAYLAQLEEQYGALGMDDVHDKCTKEEWAKYQDLVYKKQLYSLYRSGGSVYRR